MRVRSLLLLEYKRDLTLAKLHDQLEERVKSDNREGLTPEDVIDHMERTDPTKKHAFVLHLLRWYLDGSMRYLEDASKAVKPIKLYVKFKNKAKRDLKTLSFGEFLDLGDELEGAVSRKDARDAETQRYYDDGEAELWQDDDDIRITIPRTEEAAKYFGRGTRWCTAAEEDNYFDYYSEQGDLYIIEFKGRPAKWQFHFETDSYMDAKDEAIPYQAIRDEPSIQAAFDYIWSDEAKIGSCFEYLANPTEEQIAMALEQYPRNIIYLQTRPADEQIRAALSADGYLCKDFARRGWLDGDGIEELAFQKAPAVALKYYPQTQERVLMAIENGFANWNGIEKQFQTPAVATELAYRQITQLALVEHIMPEKDYVGLLVAKPEGTMSNGFRWLHLPDATMIGIIEKMDQHTIDDIFSGTIPYGIKPKIDRISWPVRNAIMHRNSHYLFNVNDLDNAPEEFKVEALKLQPVMLQKIKKPSAKAISTAIKADPSSIYHLIHPNENSRSCIDPGAAVVDYAVKVAEANKRKGDDRAFSLFNYIKHCATPYSIEVAKMNGLDWFVRDVENGHIGG